MNRHKHNLFPNPLNELSILVYHFGKEKYMIDENVTQEMHILQAAKIAEDAGAPKQVIIAMLYHDIGQLCQRINEDNNVTTKSLHYNHDEIGAEWLRARKFPDFIVDFVRYHTVAKIVLYRIYGQKYYNILSSASKDSLKIQQKKYCNDNDSSVIVEFLNHPYHKMYLIMRHIDDLSKNETYHVYIFEHYNEMIQEILNDPKGTTPSIEPINISKDHWMAKIEQRFLSSINK